MIKINKTTLTRIILVCISATLGLSLKSGNAQGNMLNPVEIMSPLVFSVQRLANGNSIFTICYSVSDVEIVEVDKYGQKVWNYEEDLAWTHSATFCKKTNTILIADTNNNRVFEVNRKKEIVWQYDHDIKYPNDADRLDNGNTLITVRDSDKIIEVTPNGKVVWEYNGVKGPHNADRLDNGNTIIANSMDNRIIEVDKTGKTVWSYEGKLFWPRDADRLDNGNTLIADTRHRRILEVTYEGKVVWELNNMPSVYDVDRLENGNTLISADLRPGQVIEVDPKGHIVWRWVASDSDKERGFQYQPSVKTSYLRERTKYLVSIAENLNIPKKEYNKISQLLNLSRKALMDRQYDLNKKLVYECVAELELIINRFQRCEKGNITGRVIDSSTKRPVANASVFLFGTIYLTETDENGRFNLGNIPRLNAGYTLIIRKPGFYEKQIGNILPNLPYMNQNEQAFQIDPCSEDTKYRNEVLTLKFAFLLEQLKQDDFAIGSKSLIIPDEYPEDVKTYLELTAFDRELVQNAIKKIKSQLDDQKSKYADLIVLTALNELYIPQLMTREMRLFDEVISSDWCRQNGCYSQSFHSPLRQGTQSNINRNLDNHSNIRLFISILRALNIPARLAWVKSHPVVQWWAKSSESEGRWINTDILTMFANQNPEAWNSATLHNVKSNELTYVCTDGNYPFFIDWNSNHEGLWVENIGDEAYFLHNDQGLNEAKFALESFSDRGFPASKLENLFIAENVPVYSRAKDNYRVFDLGVNLSLANMQKSQPIKFIIPMNTDPEYTNIVDLKVFCNHPDWVTSNEIEIMTDIETNKKMKFQVVVIQPK